MGGVGLGTAMIAGRERQEGVVDESCEGHLGRNSSEDICNQIVKINHLTGSWKKF